MRKAILLIFLFISIKAFPQITPTIYWQFEGATPYAPTVGTSANTITPNAGSGYSVNTGGPVGNYLTTSISDFSTTAGSFTPTTAMSVQFLMRPGHDFSKLRNAQVLLNGQFSVSFQYPSIIFTTSNGVEDRWQIDLEAVGKKSWKAFNDGNFHLFSFVYNAATGRKFIAVDGQTPSGFAETISVGSGNIFTSSPTLWFSTTVNYTQFAGDIDEFQIFKGELTSNQIYQNYTEFQAGQHFTNSLAASVPAPDPVTAGYDPNQYAPGYPSVTVTPIVQLEGYPGARYKPIQTAADSLLPISSCMDGIYLGGTFQSGITNAQAVLNGAEINLFLAQNYNWVLSAWGLGQGLYAADTTTFQGKVVKMAKANPKTKLEFFTFRPQLEPFDRVPFGSNQAQIIAYGYKPYYFLQNNSGQYLDENGNVTTTNRKGRPSISLAQSYSNLPDTVLLANGDTVKAAFQRVNTALGGLNTVFSINENCEDFLAYSAGAMALDPIVSSNLTSSGLTARQFQGSWRGRNEVNYKDKFVATGTITATNNTFYNVYQNQGNPNFFYDWNYLRNCHTTYRGKKMSTADMYFRDERSWFYNCHTSCADHGLSWFIQNRQEEFAAGDSLQYPYVSHGWSINEYLNVAPSEYLGLLKVLAAMGSESFKASSFWVNGQYPNPNQMIWAAVYPVYAQAVTTRYEKQLHYGKLLPGDMPATPSLPSGYAGYRYNAGDFRTFVAVRKDDLANKYVIAANHNRNSNMIGNNEDTVIRYITIAGEQLTFTVREWGSVYFYDNTNTANKVFYQLDKWHEKSHPSYWSTDFGFEAEVNDNYVPSQLKTDRAAGMPIGNYVNSTTYISYADTTATLDTIRFNFQPRTAATYYVWIRMKSRNGSATGVTMKLNTGSTKTLNVSNPAWFWYRYDGAAIPGNIISYSLTAADQHLGILPQNKYIEIDQIVLTQNASTVYPETTTPCSATSTITPSGSTTICTGQTVNLAANVMTTYLWSNGATTQSVTVSSSGTFTVTVTDGSGCTGISAPVTVTVNSPPSTPVITPSGSTTFCVGSSITLTSTAATSYLWSSGETTQAITASTAGGYTVTVTNAAGCTKSSLATTITTNALPGIPVITPTGATTFCTGSSVLLTSTAATSYLWSTGAITQAITVSTAGSYTVTVTNSNGCTRSSATTTVTVNQNPIVAAVAPQQNVCAAVTVDLSTITLTNTGAVITVKTYYATLTDAQNSTNAIASVVAATGTYYIRAEAATGCYQAVSVAVNIVSCACGAAPLANAGPDQTVCKGVVLTLAGAITNATIGTWTTTGTGAFTPSSTTLGATYTPSAADTVAGTIKLILTTNNPLGAPCVAGKDTMQITLIAHPTATISASGATTFCTGGSVNLVVTAATSYAWSTGATTQSITVASSGAFNCVVTNSTGCTSGTTANTTVTVNLPPATPTISPGGTSTVCSGGSVTLTSSAGSSYLWSTGATTLSILASSTGAYRVTVTNVAGCTASSAAKSVVVSGVVPTPIITPSGSTSLCSGSSVSLTSSVGDSYLWSNGQISQTISVSAAATYTVTVTISGCTASSAGTAITVNPLPTAIITNTGSSQICAGGSTTLLSSPGTSYLWSDGSASQSLFVTTSGTYVVTVTNAFGCTKVSAPLSITNSGTIPTTIVVTGSPTFCSGGSGPTLTAPAGYTYLWTGGLTTQSISPTTTGSYVCTVSAGSGCTGVSTPVVVTAASSPATPVITPASPISICAPQNIELVSTPSASYIWSNGETTQNIIVSMAGSYTVTVTNTGGCSKVSATTIVVAGTSLRPRITVSGGGTTFCSGGSRTLTCNGATSYLWSTGATTQAITVTTSGSYRVTVTDAFGCTGASSITSITVKAVPATPVITVNGSLTFCSNQSVFLGAPSASSYLWSNASTSQGVTIKASGTYTVTVYNSVGCSASSASVTTTKNNGCTVTCGVPTGINVTAIAKYQATIYWDQSNVNSSYRIYVQGARDGSRARVTDQPIDVRSATFQQLSRGTTYYYWMKGVCSGSYTDSTAAKIFTTTR